MIKILNIMRKILVCLLVMATFAMVACHKEEEKAPDYAADFIGNYSVTVNAVLNVPVLGEVTLPIDNMEVTVTRGVGDNEVKMSAMNQTLDGYCNASGLHLDPFVSNTSIMGTSVSVTVTMPTVPAPVNGQVNGTAMLSATVSGYSVTGTATYTGVKQN